MSLFSPRKSRDITLCEINPRVTGGVFMMGVCGVGWGRVKRGNRDYF
jgi:hypothetical protein